MLVPEGFSLQTPISVDSLDPWQETTFALRLDAAAEGSYGGDIYFFNGDVDESPFHFTVDGSVIVSEALVELDSTALTSGESSVDFGHTPTSTTVDKTFTITNVGDHSLVLGTPISVPSGFTIQSSFGSTTLAPDQSTTFTVRLTAAASGHYSGNVTFATNDPEANPFVIAVEGRVGLPEIALLLAGQPLDEGTGIVSFGHTVVCTPVERTLTIRNDGQGELVLSEPVSLPTGYSVVTSFGDTTLAPSQSTTLVVALHATAAGEYAGPLVIESNDPELESFEITVTGEVSRPDIDVSVGGAQVASGGSVDFGASAVGQGITRTIVVTNTGGNTLLLSAAPTLPAGFSLVSGYGSTTLAASQFTSFVVQYDAAAAGAAGGELVIGSNDPNEAAYVLALAGSALDVGGSLGLLNDTGSSQTDEQSSDPRILGAVQGPRDGVLLDVEVDWNDDGNPDDTLEPAANGAFVYLAPDLETGEVELNFRLRVWNDLEEDYVTGDWSPVAFTFETGTDLEPTVTDLGLRVNTGNPNDTTTSNPMLVGAIANDGRVDGYLVEIDLDNDDEPDAETVTDAVGEFGYFPAGLALGTHTVQARVVEILFDDTVVEGPWEAFTFTLVAPAAPVVTEFDLANDTGTSSTDGVTFDATLVGEVVTEGNWQLTSVELDYNNDGVVDGMAGLDADGLFEHAPQGLALGSHAIRARAVDRLNDLTGNWTSVLNVTLQAVPPPTIDTLRAGQRHGPVEH